MSYSKYNGANIDLGHFLAGNNVSPAAFIRKHHDRITHIHLKDRKLNQGPNLPWGQGDTPIKEVLQMMRKEKYNFQATIEFEYPTPEGSDVLKELAKCVQFCKDALA
jgi:sugar phosphate isomerase/epimerase